MNYKLLVLDIDGTLIDHTGHITPYTLETLMKVQRAGVKIVLASGRPTYGIMPLAEELRIGDFGGYILSYNGGKILEASTLNVIYESTLSRELIPYIYRLSKLHDTVLLTYQDEFIVTEVPDDKYVQHEAFLTKMATKQVDNLKDFIDFNPDKCLAVADPERVVALEAAILSEFGDRMNAFRSQPFFLELVPKGIDKAKSLERLLAHTGYSRSEMIAAGDGFNDLSMIEFAGLGVAMGNAQDEVKSVADFITLSNEEDGIAHMANEFIL